MTTDLTPRSKKETIFPVEVPWDAIPEASKSFTEVHLRLLMKEREEVMARLVDIDQAILELE